MPPIPAVFTIPISSTKGSVVCTRAGKTAFILTFTSPKDNRCTIPFLQALNLALDILATKHPRIPVIITSGLPKFFSNGFDLEHLAENPHLQNEALLPLMRRLYTYPAPTIAVLNGHTFGAGVFLSVGCDYSIMNGERGFWCLPEVDLGLVIPAPIIPLLRRKIPDAAVWKKTAMEGGRLSGKECLAAGIVDALGGMDEALKLITEKKLVQKALPGAWGGLRVASALEVDEGFKKAGEKTDLNDEDAITARVESWEKQQGGKAKL